MRSSCVVRVTFIKTLDSVALKRVVNAYAIYHNELNGNSYISNIYDEMMEWEHVN